MAGVYHSHVGALPSACQHLRIEAAYAVHWELVNMKVFSSVDLLSYPPIWRREGRYAVALGLVCVSARTWCQRLQQCGCLPQVSGVEALGKPAVDFGQEPMGCGALPLQLPQPAQAYGSPQLP